ncbi:MAG: thiamine phosphate synthase [Hyphomicrobium sp.]|nr:thiamine phosphate synthase [Hyphomicrobium sp.]PPC80757.1 MAG: thiamine phosphate synthase [Hyphomicrobium sp.]
MSPLVQLAQKQGIAVLVEGDARLARTVKADGMHIPASNDPLSAFEEAREILGARAIVGVDAGRSRHDAMSLGEAGADYIGFGLPARAKQTAADVDDDKAFRLDLVQWWSEIFEIPCVAFDIDKTDDAAELADARADFVAVRLPASIDAADAERWLQGFNGALAATTAA